jgi:hypothetical protein
MWVAGMYLQRLAEKHEASSAYTLVASSLNTRPAFSLNKTSQPEGTATTVRIYG